MPIDPSVLLLGLQPQARTPYDAPDVVAERRARVEQLREAAKAKQDAEYENQLYDWAVKSNLGPDGTPDFEGVRKSLAQVAPRTLQKFDAAMNTAKKSTLETQKLQDDHRAALTGWAGSAFNNADETNYGDIFPVVQKGAPELVKQYGLTGDYQHDKGAIGAVRSAATSMPEQLKAAEEARGHVLKNEWDLAAAKKLDALATSGQLTDDTLVSGLNELRDVGMPTSVYQRWNIPLEKAAALAKNIQITPEQRVQAQQATDTLDETKRAHDLEQQARDAAAKRADLSAGALDAYRKARLAQGANRPVGGRGAAPSAPVPIVVGTPDFTVAQDLAYGRITPGFFRTMVAYSRDPDKKFAVYAKARELNPDFNEADFERGFKFISSPRIASQLAALDNVEAGVPDLLKASDAASRLGATVLNKAVIPGGIALGKQQYSNFATARTAFADELSGALGFGSATDMSREMGFDMTNGNLSPDNFRSAVQDIVVPFVRRKRANMLKQASVYGKSSMNSGVSPEPYTGERRQTADGRMLGKLNGQTVELVKSGDGWVVK